MTLAVRNPRRRRIATLTACALICFFLGSLWTSQWWLPSPLSQVERMCEQLRAEGFAVTTAEWAGEGAPPELNVITELTDADRALHERLGERIEWPTRAHAFDVAPSDAWQMESGVDGAALDVFLLECTTYFDRIEAALERPQCTWTYSTAADGEASGSRIRCVRVLTAALARRGRSESERLRGVALRIRLAAAAHRPPAEIVPEIAAMEAEMCIDLRELLTRNLLDARVAADTLRGAWPRTTLAERVESGGRALLAGFAERECEIWRSPERFPHESFVPVSREWCGRLILQVRGGSEQILRGLADAASVRGESAPDLALQYDRLESESSAPRRIGVAGIRSAFRDATDREARLRLARVAVEVAAHEAMTGSWPATLEALSDPFLSRTVPEDPYTDAPFVYEVTEDRVRIASAGRLPGDDPVDEAELRERGLVWEFPR